MAFTRKLVTKFEGRSQIGNRDFCIDLTCEGEGPPCGNLTLRFQMKRNEDAAEDC